MAKEKKKKVSKVDILLGLQWGDEGKGKIVDFITPKYKAVARFQGGPNAGHTLEFGKKKYILHTIPSGIFRDNIKNIIGNGLVIDPFVLKKELKDINLKDTKNLFISKKAHLILPTHKILDAASEQNKGNEKIGTTLKGISPSYMDKTGRNGLRVQDVFLKNFKEKYNQLVKKHKSLLSIYNYKYDLTELENTFFESLKTLKSLNVIDSEYFINDLLEKNQKILAEGAQGTMLDIEFGSYPYVTSSNTTSAGACTGLGIAPTKINKIFGVFKAYCTRVGKGPFPSEINDEYGNKMQTIGKEYGSTTGRKRRCGWVDLVALKYACMINGVTHLFMMKADILSSFKKIKVAVAYEYNGTKTTIFNNSESDKVVPIYKEFEGWNKNLSNTKYFNQLPKATLNYINFIEDYLKIPIVLVSYGPKRNETIIKNEFEF